MARITKAEKAESRERLLEWLKPGDTVHCVLRSVARSGMSRTIDFYKLTGNGPMYLSYHIARILGYSQTKDGALKVSGCGMDMGFHVVHSLCYALWGTAPDAKLQARHELHELHKRPGYQLKAEWL